MSFNQKAVSAITALAVGATAAIALVAFEPPYSANFWIGFFALAASQTLFGAFWVQQIAKSGSVLPVALGVWGLNAGYFAFTLAATLMTGMAVRHYALLHVVGFTAFVMLHVLFYMAGRQVEEQSRDEGPETKIEKAKVTWR